MNKGINGKNWMNGVALPSSPPTLASFRAPPSGALGCSTSAPTQGCPSFPIDTLFHSIKNQMRIAVLKVYWPPRATIAGAQGTRCCGGRRRQVISEPLPRFPHLVQLFGLLGTRTREPWSAGGRSTAFRASFSSKSADVFRAFSSIQLFASQNSLRREKGQSL